MRDPWEVLRAAGVPDGAPRPPTAFPDAADLRAALDEVLTTSVPEAALDALWAWLRGFRQHWPDRFEEVLGPTGHVALESLGRRPCDQNRYLKLRRIAIAQLAG